MINNILLVLGSIVIGILFLIIIYDRFFQTKNLIIGNFPLIGRLRYVFHDLRPFFRQYFGDDNAFSPRIIIDWILNVSIGKSGYFAFDKFDTTGSLHDGAHQMIHATPPLNDEEMAVTYPVLGEKRAHPLPLQSYFYRSAMSLGSLGFEATSAMAAACADEQVPFNTGEGGLSIHHLPRMKFSYDRMFLKYKKIPRLFKFFYQISPGARLKNYLIDTLGHAVIGRKFRDLYLFCPQNFVFYTIDWEAPIAAFPNPADLEPEFGQIIFQIGSGMYGLRQKTPDGSFAFDFDRFQKIASFCRAFEIKLAQGAKQTGGILKAKKNTPVIAEIRGVHPGIDLISPNRFPFYPPGGEKEFFEFIEKISVVSGKKPVGIKLVISDESNIEPLVKELNQTPLDQGPDFFTIDGGDGGSGAAPLSLGILFGKKIFEALPIVVKVLEKYKMRDRVKILAAAKLYAPHLSARALACGADAVGNARSIMIAGGCIRSGFCSGEHHDCPVGLATMNKSKRRAYAVAWDAKVSQIRNYLAAHNRGIIQVAAICGVRSPSLLNPSHLVPVSK